MKESFLSDYWNMLSDYIEDDVPIQALSMFLNGYSLLLFTVEDYFLSLTFFDRLIQSILFGFFPTMLLIVFTWQIMRASYDITNKLNSYFDIEKYVEIKTEEEEIRKEAISTTLVLSLMISSALVIYHWMFVINLP